MAFAELFLFSILGVLSLIVCRATGTTTTSSRPPPQDTIEYLLTDRNKIFRIRPHIGDGGHGEYSTDATSIADVDYHQRANLLFWIDAESGAIRSGPLNGVSSFIEHHHRAFAQQPSRNDWKPVALAVDQVDDKIYVADALGAKIDVFELDGRYRAVALGSDLGRPLDLRLASREGRLFVLDGRRIVGAGLDGSEPRVLIGWGVDGSRGLSLDTEARRIYWVWAEDSTLASSDYEGGDVRNLTGTRAPEPWAKFAAHNDSVVWSSEFAGLFDAAAIRCCDGEPPVPTIRALINYPPRNPTENPCSIRNGECEQLCVSLRGSLLASPHRPRHRCACTAGLTLAANGRNCSAVRDILAYTPRPGLLKSSLAAACNLSRAFCEPFLPLLAAAAGRIRDFTYSFAEGGQLYYAETRQLARDLVRRVRWQDAAGASSGGGEVFISGVSENYGSLAVDWARSRLYYTDDVAGTLSVIGTRDRRAARVVLRNVEKPENLVVHPARGLLFFLQTNSSTRISWVSRVRVDGANLTRLPGVELRGGCGLALDYRDERIYWYEWRSNEGIRSRDLDFRVASERSLLEPAWLTTRVYALAVHQEWLYVATSRSEGIWRLGKVRGEAPELVVADRTNGIARLKVFSEETQRMGDGRVEECSNGSKGDRRETDKCTRVSANVTG